MTKAELIEKMATDAELTRAAAGKALDSMIDQIGSALKAGERVTIVGFGTFSVSDRAERKGRNPQTGEEITIKASRAPKFSAGKGFKDLLN